MGPGPPARRTGRPRPGERASAAGTVISVRAVAGGRAAWSGDVAALLRGRVAGMRHASVEPCPPAVHVRGAGRVQAAPLVTGQHTDTGSAGPRRGVVLAPGGGPAVLCRSAMQAGQVRRAGVGGPGARPQVALLRQSLGGAPGGVRSSLLLPLLGDPPGAGGLGGASPAQGAPIPC